MYSTRPACACFSFAQRGLELVRESREVPFRIVPVPAGRRQRLEEELLRRLREVERVAHPQRLRRQPARPPRLVVEALGEPDEGAGEGQRVGGIRLPVEQRPAVLVEQFRADAGDAEALEREPVGAADEPFQMFVGQRRRVDALVVDGDLVAVPQVVVEEQDAGRGVRIEGGRKRAGGGEGLREPPRGAGFSAVAKEMAATCPTVAKLD